MRTLLVCFALLLIAVPSVGFEAKKQVASVKGLAFLAGTWKGDIWGGKFTAYYTTPEGGKVLSYSELRRGDKLAFHEFEKFDVRDGKVTFAPFPGGKPAKKLHLMSLDAKAKKATFENPKKDFPTRIVYHRVSDTRLVITLSDPHNKSEKKEVFDLTREKD